MVKSPKTLRKKSQRRRRASCFILVVALLFFGAVALYLLVPLIQSVGYFGTTSLRPVAQSQPIWKNFLTLFGGSKTRPYIWKNSRGPEHENDIIKFDKRLIRSLDYLKKVTNTGCGWDGEHIIVRLDTDAPKETDLTTPPYNLPSGSTVNRGVGVRVDLADQVRCSIKYICTPDPNWYRFLERNIPFAKSKTVCSDNPCPPQPSCTLVDCAVDYYPHYPVDVPICDKTPLNDAPLLAKLNPGIFPYNAIIPKGKEAAVYKAAQIAYQLMSIDKNGCETAQGNRGYKTNIPLQIIFPAWIQRAMGNTWQELSAYHTDNFSLLSLKKSKFAGTAYDPKLDEKGLHFNY